MMDLRIMLKIKYLFIVLISLIFLQAGCARQQIWYNPGHSQMDFDRDSQECSIAASALARQATLTGKREDPATYVRVYNGCIHEKGWSQTPPAESAKDSGAGRVQAQQLALLHANGTIEAFDRRLQVPEGFVLEADGIQGREDTLLQSFLFRNGELFINYTFQKSLGRRFEAADYPVAEPFFLYEQGMASRKPDVRWAVFAGNLQASWVAGLGGYFLLNKRERIIIVVTRSLPSPAERVPAGLRLTSEQFQAMEQFRDQWLGWLPAQVKS
jgi:hypothetical protein